MIVEIKCTINVIHLKHPQTTPSPGRGKIIFHETDPWYQSLWTTALSFSVIQLRKALPFSAKNLYSPWAAGVGRGRN